MLRASKWQKLALLIDSDEMSDLLQTLQPFFLFPTSGPVTQPELTSDEFLQSYRRYIETLKAGKPFDDGEWRRAFALAMTRVKEQVEAVPVSGNRLLMRPRLPVVLLQYHTFIASKEDGNLYSMVASSQTVSWGIQFSYPHLYEDPESGAIEKANDLPDSALFRELQRWTRKATQPTPFLFQGQKINAPMRISKSCFAWIQQHHGLKAQGIQVHAS